MFSNYFISNISFSKCQIRLTRQLKIYVVNFLLLSDSEEFVKYCPLVDFNVHYINWSFH